MRERLEAFKALCQEYDAEHRSHPSRYTDRERQLGDKMAMAMPTVKEILKHLDPTLPEQVKEPAYIGGTHDSLRAVQQGLGVLQDQDEWVANLAPDAPSLVADQYHPHVWSVASALWDTGQYRVAVGQAAISLSAHIASRVGSSLTERKLVQQLFSPNDPTPGQVRLHLPGDKASDTWRSRQEGLHLVAQGAFAGIRNPAVHTTDEWTEQVALEHLALLSVVARWSDETVVVKAP